MDDIEIQKKIRKIICDLTEKDNITDDMQMTEELGFESIMIIELITRIEEEYGIEIDSFTDLIEAFTTAGSVVQYFVGVILKR